jgi:mono/diheme cytochrome c family protein
VTIVPDGGTATLDHATTLQLAPTLAALLWSGGDAVALRGDLARADPARVDFARDVQPILSNHCFACHGPDAAERKAGLRLDTQDGATALLDSGNRAVVGRESELSELLARIDAESPRRRMPPAAFGKPLSDAQRATLRRWIEEGGGYARHWSFAPPTKSPLPAVRDRDWPRHELDTFILARLEQEGLAPSLPTDPATLLRRTTLALTGLPPSPAEQESFLAEAALDRGPGSDAFERRVDQLLASPAAAEHQARLWLDLARYGDTHGYHLDNERALWRWRDWVIEAFRRNLPWDRFTLEQLAGDLLPDADERTRLATGFLRCNPTTGEGGLIEEEYLVKYAVDRVNTLGTVWLGLTVGCAQCHDHKFDPITQRDYFGLFAFFNGIAERGTDENALAPAPAMAAPLPGQAERRAALAAELAAADAALAAARFEPMALLQRRAQHGTVRELLADGSLLATGPSPATEIETFEFGGLPRELSALKLEALTDPSLPGGGPGRFENGNFVLTGASAEFVAPDGTATPLPIARAVADHAQADFPIERALDDDPKSGWAILPELSSHHALLLPAAPIAVPAGARVRLTLRHESIFERHVIGRVRVTACGARDFAAIAARHATAAAALATLDATIPQAMVAAELPMARPTHLLRRGQYDQKGDVVAPALPAALGALPAGAKPDRLALAQWLTRPDHPLAARVVVNRTWMQLFGDGLVRTVEDFGAQGELPSHAELLDWLAVDFVQHGFDLRRLQRQIVLSATWRQSARVTPELMARDGGNRLLARAPRLRLDAEVIRDQALAASGLLVAQVGGRSVKPYQPGDLWKPIAYPTSNTASFVQDHGDALWRRSLYTFWKRTAPPPNLAAFDAPSRESCTVQRARTNTPLQALVLLNDVQFVEAARILAQRVLRETSAEPPERISASGGEASGDTVARVTLLWRLALARPPTVAELALARGALAREQARFAAEPARAAALLAQGEAPRDATLAPAVHAAWTLLASTLFNVDEFVTRG